MNKILKALLLTIAGALLVSFLKEQQLTIAVLLLSVLFVHLGVLWSRHRDPRPVFEELFNLITFGVIGFLTESWGTQNGHWTYHHLPPGQSVPLWVPIAWSIASVMLAKAEDYLHTLEAKRKTPHSLPVRLGYIYLLGILLPLAGESICIAMGVWEYHWPLKILGVPLLALLLISYAHLVFCLIRSGGSLFWRHAHGVAPE